MPLPTLANTVKDVLRYRPEQKPALLEAVEVELVKAKAKLQICEIEIRSPRARRGTRSGRNIGARFNRAYDKVHFLTEALNNLKA